MASGISALALRHLSCPRCAAAPGSPCRTRSDRLATQVHSGRRRPLDDAWREGYSDGRAGAAYQLAGKTRTWNPGGAYTRAAIEDWLRAWGDRWYAEAQDR